MLNVLILTAALGAPCDHGYRVPFAAVAVSVVRVPAAIVRAKPARRVAAAVARAQPARRIVGRIVERPRLRAVRRFVFRGR